LSVEARGRILVPNGRNQKFGTVFGAIMLDSRPKPSINRGIVLGTRNEESVLALKCSDLGFGECKLFVVINLYEGNKEPFTAFVTGILLLGFFCLGKTALL
jgi:hypothetical protein